MSNGVLLTASSFDKVATNEMNLAADLIPSTPDNPLTLFYKGLYSLGLLNECKNTGTEPHWLIPLKKEHNLKRLENSVGEAK
jgi:hypothetical protein